jgi:hypothetical protein
VAAEARAPGPADAAAPAPADLDGPSAAVGCPQLPELATVPWRARVDERSLDRSDLLWTLTTLAHVLPFVAAAAFLLYLEPLSAPVAIICLAHAWITPALYAQRGANVVKPRPRGAAAPERVSVGLLGDLIGHEARALHARSGLVVEPGALGTWVVGEAGALLVRPPRERGRRRGWGRRAASRPGRRVECFCVQVREPDLPSGDRIAHLLLALRADEAGFATVANLAFSGARRRVAPRLRAGQREALEFAASSPGRR